MTPADDAALNYAATLLALRAERLALRFDMGIIEAREQLDDLDEVRRAVRVALEAWKAQRLAQLREELLADMAVSGDAHVSASGHSLSDARIATVH